MKDGIITKGNGKPKIMDDQEEEKENTDEAKTMKQ